MKIKMSKIKNMKHLKLRQDQDSVEKHFMLPIIFSSHLDHSL